LCNYVSISKGDAQMTKYKRIVEIKDADWATLMAVSADRHGLTFRRARSGGDAEYVIEGNASLRRVIDAISETAEQGR
jgi:hypothetical protein